MKPPTVNTQSEKAAETRARILDAALSEFALHGLAGARTERIAEAAGVNKALLYYYFASKDKLYAAALEMIAGRVRDTSLAVLELDASPGERLMRAALNHFDRILGQQEFQSLMQQEMVRLHKGEPGVLPVLVHRVFEPLLLRFREIVQQGVASGELIHADWMQIQLACLGANVLFFLSSPIYRLVFKEEPLAKESLSKRRKAVVEYLGQALFRDRQHGAELAKKVYRDTPMPDIKGDRFELRRDV